MTFHEAKSLVALLHSNDEVLLERTLTTIANCGTFASNQVTNFINLQMLTIMFFKQIIIK